MIVIYPMLISQSVSPTILPGIIKAVEKYILVYNSDAVLRAASSTAAGRILSTGAAIVAGTVVAAGAGAVAQKVVDKIMDADEVAVDYLNHLHEAYGKSTTKTTTTKNQQTGQSTTTSTGKTQTVDTAYRPTSNVKPSLDIPSRQEGIALEPTWMTVTTQKKGVQVLGVKVVPFRVKSTENLSQLLMNDTQLKYLDFLATKFGRGITKIFGRFLKKLPFVKAGTVTGDPRKDVILGSTKYRDNMFVCINQLDLESSEVFTSPQGIRKLQQLGWTSMVLTDDVNRRATFCMKEFGGVCSVIPYNYMFASFGKDLNKAYEDLEDLKKTSGPFFLMKTNRRRAFGEACQPVVDRYLDTIQES